MQRDNAEPSSKQFDDCQTNNKPTGGSSSRRRCYRNRPKPKRLGSSKSWWHIELTLTMCPSPLWRTLCHLLLCPVALHLADCPIMVASPSPEMRRPNRSTLQKIFSRPAGPQRSNGYWPTGTDKCKASRLWSKTFHWAKTRDDLGVWGPICDHNTLAVVDWPFLFDWSTGTDSRGRQIRAKQIAWHFLRLFWLSSKHLRGPVNMSV